MLLKLSKATSPSGPATADPLKTSKDSPPGEVTRSGGPARTSTSLSSMPVRNIISTEVSICPAWTAALETAAKTATTPPRNSLEMSLLIMRIPASCPADR
jgi:hypothetical protein